MYCWCMRRSCRFFRSISYDCAYYPVSYTHLDVYKRQGYPFPMLAKKLSPFILTTEVRLILPNLHKRKTLQSVKITTLFNLYSVLPDTFICPLFRLLKLPAPLRLQSVCRYRSYHQGERQAAAAWYLFRRSC